MDSRIKDPGKGRLQKGDNFDPRITDGQCKLLTSCIFSFSRVNLGHSTDKNC